LKTARESGVKANAVLFTILIAAYARMHDPNMALRTFKQMTAIGISPDVPSIDAVVSAFYAVGAYSTSRRLLITLWTYIQPFPETLRESDLKTLAVSFRALHGLPPRNMKLSKSEKMAIYIRVKKILTSFHVHFWDGKYATSYQQRSKFLMKSWRPNSIYRG